jgi:hypothetical protein
MFSLLVKLKESAAEPKQQALAEKIQSGQNVPKEQVKQPDLARKPDVRQEPPVPVEPPAVQAGAVVQEKEVKQEKDMVPAALQHNKQQVGINPLCYHFSAGSITPNPSLSEEFNPLKTKRRLLYLKTQSVLRCKHFSSRLQKPVSLCCVTCR